MDTTASPDMRGYSRWHMTTRRLAHAAPLAYGGASTLWALLGFLDDQHDWLLSPIRALLAFASFIPVLAAITVHSNGECAVCQAQRPVDGHAAANHHHAQLSIAHLRWPVAAAGWLTVAAIGTSDWVSTPGVRECFNLIVGLIIAVMIHMEITHHQLEPWCPRCHRRRGDDAPQTDR